jgi:hypothetical protein
VKDVQSFFRFLAFYQQFIKGFRDYVKLLTCLTRKDYMWRWGELMKKVFDQSILAVTSKPVLHFPTDIEKWWVEVDSSDYVTGACLMQCQNRVWVPIAFMSKGLNYTGRNYDIHNKEMLAIM